MCFAKRIALILVLEGPENGDRTIRKDLIVRRNTEPGSNMSIRLWLVVPRLSQVQWQKLEILRASRTIHTHIVEKRAGSGPCFLETVHFVWIVDITLVSAIDIYMVLTFRHSLANGLVMTGLT